MKSAQEQAFTEFVTEHGAALLRYARWLIPDRDEAEDALQTALMRLVRHWHDRVAPDAYVRASLRNLAIDRSRRAHRVPTPHSVGSSADRLESPNGDPGEALAAQAVLDHVLAELPPRQRLTVVLRVLEGLSEAETAEVMNCAVGTVKSNLHRGLRAAADILPTLTEPDR